MGRQLLSLLALGAFVLAAGAGCDKGGGNKVEVPSDKAPAPKVSNQKAPGQPKQKEAD